MDWKSYLDVSMFLAPNDENRVRFLTNQVIEDSAAIAKNIAVSAAVEQFFLCWIAQKSGTVYLGDRYSHEAFDYTRYDPRTDPLYTYGDEPNFKCGLVLPNFICAVLFFSPDPFDGSIEQLIVLSIRVNAYRLKLGERERRHNFWMKETPQGLCVVSPNLPSIQLGIMWGNEPH